MKTTSPVAILYIFSIVFLLAALCRASPTQRFGHTSVLLPNGTMLIFGGYNFQSVDYANQVVVGLLNDIWLCDFSNSSGNGTIWTQVVPTVGSSIPQPRMMHTAAFIADTTGNSTGKMIIQGGTPRNDYKGDRTSIYYACAANDLWAFDIDSLNWTRVFPVSDSDLASCLTGAANRLLSATVLVITAALTLAGRM